MFIQQRLSPVDVHAPSPWALLVRRCPAGRTTSLDDCTQSGNLWLFTRSTATSSGVQSTTPPSPRPWRSLSLRRRSIAPHALRIVLLDWPNTPTGLATRTTSYGTRIPGLRHCLTAGHRRRVVLRLCVMILVLVRRRATSPRSRVSFRSRTTPSWSSARNSSPGAIGALLVMVIKQWLGLPEFLATLLTHDPANCWPTSRSTSTKSFRNFVPWSTQAPMAVMLTLC
mmetsp:Transcript_64208/g.178364  ORF Transcript_64208/g.178364 Transcript_64208/m.178364 type:complete len:226 (-) Transcript_64208:70-747(-)